MDEVKLRELRDKVILRLQGFGIETTEADNPLIELLVNSQNHWILTEINHPTLPEELEYALIDRVCGEWLKLKQISDAETSVDPFLVVKTIRMGDTTFDMKEGMSPADTMQILIRYLSQRGDDQWSAFRRLRW